MLERLAHLLSPGEQHVPDGGGSSLMKSHRLRLKVSADFRRLGKGAETILPTYEGGAVPVPYHLLRRYRRVVQRQADAAIGGAIRPRSMSQPAVVQRSLPRFQRHVEGQTLINVDGNLLPLSEHVVRLELILMGQ